MSQSIFLSENTIKNHVASLLRKLDVKDRTTAVIRAYQHGWIKGLNTLLSNQDQKKRTFHSPSFFYPLLFNRFFFFNLSSHTFSITF
ncbi:response regulator transcription factor [Fictibacillus norfolkensis]|uniref:Response regulator transcription factor n=1 Tax=Fictibacillus norfolkensis TaxID=2762233 RepID=A0ABR8SHM3_9BACL|nr:response regulator transcription factor [Fictibacillus norfolkensis]